MLARVEDHDSAIAIVPRSSDGVDAKYNMVDLAVVDGDGYAVEHAALSDAGFQLSLLRRLRGRKCHYTDISVADLQAAADAQLRVADGSVSRARDQRDQREAGINRKVRVPASVAIRSPP
jgi:hypothetical protein